MEDLFIKASRAKLRFKANNGLVTTEDLWDLRLESIDNLAKALNKEVKDSSEESFIKTRTTANKELELKFEVVKYVIKVRLEEEQLKKDRAERKRKKEYLLELIAQKEDQALSNKSVDELKAELMSLED